MSQNRTITRYRIPALLMVCVALVASGCSLFDYEEAYAPTPPGTAEFKTLPASKTLVAEREGSYFEASNGLFMRLFNFIRAENVAMTVPVESRSGDRSSMTFFVGSKDSAKTLKDRDEVKVTSVPERRVASLGGRGSYTKENFEKTRKKLIAWLDGQKTYRAAGSAYGVYWNSPFMPGFLKRYEVHLPVEPVDRDEERGAERTVHEMGSKNHENRRLFIDGSRAM